MSLLAECAEAAVGMVYFLCWPFSICVVSLSLQIAEATMQLSDLSAWLAFNNVTPCLNFRPLGQEQRVFYIHAQISDSALYFSDSALYFSVP